MCNTRAVSYITVSSQPAQQQHLHRWIVLGGRTVMQQQYTTTYVERRKQAPPSTYVTLTLRAARNINIAHHSFISHGLHVMLLKQSCSFSQSRASSCKHSRSDYCCTWILNLNIYRYRSIILQSQVLWYSYMIRSISISPCMYNPRSWNGAGMIWSRDRAISQSEKWGKTRLYTHVLRNARLQIQECICCCLSKCTIIS